MRPTVTLRATPRPKPGTAAKARRARKAYNDRAERIAKETAKGRDRWTCRRCHRSTLDLMETVEAAHINSKGMGGDHGLRSSTSADYVTLCRSCHQGPRSVHSGHVVIECGPARGDGPVTFIEADPRHVGRYVVAIRPAPVRAKVSTNRAANEAKVVVGSKARRRGDQTTAPLTNTTRKEIEQRG
jgi:hypothetical protein